MQVNFRNPRLGFTKTGNSYLATLSIFPARTSNDIFTHLVKIVAYSCHKIQRDAWRFVNFPLAGRNSLILIIGRKMPFV
jgi:hypothetical protein